ncbi:MAG: hypothetical protein RL148_776 [Planctomycetota bacterium]|jgi:hypothetical protein
MNPAKIARLVVLPLLCSAVLTAQEPAGKEPRPGHETPKEHKGVERHNQVEMERVAEQMRRQLEEGKTIRSHVRVQVRLSNGNRVRGVVKDGRLIERVDGLRFVRAAENEAGSGIRIWYTDGRASFVFVPFSQIANYDVQERLSSEQLAKIEAEALQLEQSDLEQKARAKAEAEAAQQSEVPAGTGTVTEPLPAKEVGGAPPKPAAGSGRLTEEQRELFRLLVRYPPADGWSAEKAAEIRRRRAVVGSNPTELEWAFVENFADWQRAVDMFGAPAGEKKPAPAPSGEEQPAQDGRKRRKTT